jgi:N-acetylmuramoyl-L-alanine amidase
MKTAEKIPLTIMSVYSTDTSSPNFNDRADGQAPSMIILHYTGMQSAQAAIERLCDPAAQVSAHYVVDEDGRTAQLVDDEKRAWHAGVSFWQGLTDINSASVGIEIVNPGHEFGYRAFPDAQIAAVITLCQDLMKRHNIPPSRVLGHSDIAPMRKDDPGELFPWEKLAQHGIGLWPQVSDLDFQAAKDLADHPAWFHDLLIECGYDASADESAAITAFHRHYYPEKFTGEHNPQEIDQTSVARLLALLRAMHEESAAPA